MFNKIHPTTWRFLIVFSAIFITGCATMNYYKSMLRYDINYNVSIKNNSSSTIDVLEAQYGQVDCSVGILKPSVRKTTMGVNMVPNQVSIKWNKGHHNFTVRTVEVRNQIPSFFKYDRDELIFNINDNDTVTLTFEIEPEKYSWIEVDKDGKILERTPVTYLKNQKYYK